MVILLFLKKKKKNFIASFYGWVQLVQGDGATKRREFTFSH